MKEIIEKYKNRKLRVLDCAKSGVVLNDLDVVDLYLGDTPRGTRMTYDELVTNFSNVGAATVVTCLVLDKLIIDGDKEIAAMEKQPEYEYVKVKSVFELDKEEVRKGVYGQFYDTGEFYQITGECELVKVLMNDKLLRRVEITPEQRREREVEELAKGIYEACESPGRTDDWDIVAARAALKWMESKK